jgi:hypothetical protein
MIDAIDGCKTHAGAMVTGCLLAPPKTQEGSFNTHFAV